MTFKEKVKKLDELFEEQCDSQRKLDHAEEEINNLIASFSKEEEELWHAKVLEEYFDSRHAEIDERCDNEASSLDRK